ncbi:MAG: hypothetical protein JO262_14185 [Solirubrobacterales bacterium]|nr:hypothetical protein [Solirubrobacterales bacterium]
MQRRFGWYEWATVALGAALVGFGIAQAIWEHSWAPIWTVGWIPAVLAASLGTRRTRDGCWPRSRRRSGA